MSDLPRRLAAEAVGTALLLAIVVGSGIMGETLSPDTGIALLANAIATGAGLVVLILIFGPVSGAHFNPAVTLAFLIRGEISVGAAALYVLIQIIFAILGVVLAHAMFDMALLQESEKVRTSTGLTISEGVATFCLVLTILGTVRFRPDAVPYAVGLVITAGYWFTSSTSFANPTVTVARSFTNTFSGIDPGSVSIFMGMQIFGAVVATLLARWLFAEKRAD